ncbi:MAG: hypothetical protein QXU18_10185 [Thermoplasmatales archaeon]
MGIDEYVNKPEIRSATGELKKHYAEIGKRFVFFDNRMNHNGDLYVVMRKVVGVNTPYESAEPRKHTVDAYMLFFGDGENLEGLKFEVLLGDEKKTYTSPKSVFIPKDTLNSYKIIEGSGYYMKLVKAPDGDYNNVTY